jgi:hypothetical protein
MLMASSDVATTGWETTDRLDRRLSKMSVDCAYKSLLRLPDHSKPCPIIFSMLALRLYAKLEPLPILVSIRLCPVLRFEICCYLLEILSADGDKT